MDFFCFTIGWRNVGKRVRLRQGLFLMGGGIQKGCMGMKGMGP